MEAGLKSVPSYVPPAVPIVGPQGGSGLLAPPPGGRGAVPGVPPSLPPAGGVRGYPTPVVPQNGPSAVSTTPRVSSGPSGGVEEGQLVPQAVRAVAGVRPQGVPSLPGVPPLAARWLLVHRQHTRGSIFLPPDQSNFFAPGAGAGQNCRKINAVFCPKCRGRANFFHRSRATVCNRWPEGLFRVCRRRFQASRGYPP